MADVKEADHLAALAAANKKSETDLAAANAAGATAAAAAVKAERARIAGIMALPEAKDRQKLAAHLAQKTEMSVEDAKAMLAEAAVETAAAATPTGKKEKTFADVMTKGNPELHQTDGEGGDDGEANGASAADTILVNYYKAGGFVKGMGDDQNQQRRRN